LKNSHLVNNTGGGDFSCCLSKIYLIFEFWGIFGFFLTLWFTSGCRKRRHWRFFYESTLQNSMIREKLWNIFESRRFFVSSKSTSSGGNRDSWMTRWRGCCYLLLASSHERLECPRNLLFCLPLKMSDGEDFLQYSSFAFSFWLVTFLIFSVAKMELFCF